MRHDVSMASALFSYLPADRLRRVYADGLFMCGLRKDVIAVSYISQGWM